MKIKSIEKVKEKRMTLDIEVANTHTYQLANGMITHNTSSLVLETASGIHPHHARKYIRRVQVNKIDPVYKFFKKTNPLVSEESVWSANKTDDVISFPVEVSEKAIVKKDLSAIDHLNIIRKTQENWVMSGATEVNKKGIMNNVSCTVLVKDKEWKEVIDYLYDNKQYFTAVSFLPDFGDKLFEQAPLEEITDSKEDQEKWDKLINNFKSVDYSLFSEKEDKTSLSDTIACGGGLCDVSFQPKVV